MEKKKNLKPCFSTTELYVVNRVAAYFWYLYFEILVESRKGKIIIISNLRGLVIFSRETGTFRCGMDDVSTGTSLNPENNDQTQFLFCFQHALVILHSKHQSKIPQAELRNWDKGQNIVRFSRKRPQLMKKCQGPGCSCFHFAFEILHTKFRSTTLKPETWKPGSVYQWLFAACTGFRFKYDVRLIPR